jgi:hypothetical protein
MVETTITFRLNVLYLRCCESNMQMGLSLKSCNRRTVFDQIVIVLSFEDP